jgi:hypothetical protein
MRLTILLDTNVLIPLEPTSPADLERGSPLAFRVASLAQQVSAGLFLHPAQIDDLRDDRNEVRRTLRLSLAEKYPKLPSPPPVPDRILSVAGKPQRGTNSWVDGQLVAALEQSAVGYLVTEDKGIHRICRALGIDGRCLSLEGAIDLLDSERVVAPVAPPATRAIHAHELDADDPIFQSLRADYPPFDAWLQKCKREHRHGWIVTVAGSSSYAGVCIINPEDQPWSDAKNPTLKICTFKIGEQAIGLKLGELLLRAVFDYVRQNDFETVFIEVFPKHGALLHLLDDFGFEQCSHKDETGELILRKRFGPTKAEDHQLPALAFHRQFGPYQIKWSGISGFIVPIEPRFHAALFPELEPQGSLFAGAESFGNTLRKAYICRAQTRAIRPGDILLFYRSGDWKSGTTLGVVEETLATADADAMKSLVRKRTVYRDADLESMCRGDGALALMFRHADVLRHRLPLAELVENGIVTAAPQSITSLRPQALTWIQNHL